MAKEKNFGYIKSTITGAEPKVDMFTPFVQIPESYELKSLSSVKDQGNKPICASEVISEMVRWKLAVKNREASFSDSVFYDLNPESTKDGMTPKSGLETLLKNSKNITGIDFTTYALVMSKELAKLSIMQHGPLLVGLPVRDSSRSDFWKGGSIVGGHAVAFVGFDEYGFKLKNSWGYSYGNGGYYDFPYGDVNCIYEMWALIG